MAFLLEETNFINVTDNNYTNDTTTTTTQIPEYDMIMFRLVTYLIVPLYSGLFAIGVVGNCWVISIVFGIFRTLRSVTNQNVFIYILSLSIVDLLVVCMIPFVVIRMLYHEWIFGYYACKLFFGVECINKILSTFILTAVSWDRYMAICYPLKTKVHSTKVVLTIIFASAFVVALLLLPIHVNAKSMQVKNYGYVCSDNLGPALRRAFMIYIFMLGYFVPAILMTTFYSRLMSKLYGHSRNFRNSRSQVPVRKVALSTLLVVGFYYFFWTPYWILQLVTIVPDWPDGTFGRSFVIVSFVFMALPYASSAFNWIFYAFLNKQLRQSYGNAQKVKRFHTQRKHSATNSCSMAINANVIDKKLKRMSTFDCAEMQPLHKSTFTTDVQLTNIASL